MDHSYGEAPNHPRFLWLPSRAFQHPISKADVPILQLSLDMKKSADFHFQLGQKLQFLREQGIWIVGSGNIVHNLRFLNWDENAPAQDWALEFDEWAKSNIENKNFMPLVRSYLATEAGRRSVPTPDHYYPLLYVLGASQPEDSLHFITEGIQNASISMRSLRLG